MYIIVSYDVNQKSCDKIRKLLRRYLFHIHNSVFEGEITKKNLDILKRKVNEILNYETDRFIIYKLLSDKYLHKDYIGNNVEIKCFFD